MYKGVIKNFIRYWGAYGGWKALFCSPYLHISIILGFLTWNTWWNECWWETVIGIIPNLLGFTLGGFAIFISFGNEKFQSILATPDRENLSKKDEDGSESKISSNKNEKPTIYISLCATFVHFIIVQMFSLIYAILVKSMQFNIPIEGFGCGFLFYSNKFFSFLGYTLFLYGLMAMIAATMHVLRIAYMFSAFQKSLQDKDNSEK